MKHLRNVNIETERVIYEVQLRPQLWNKNDESYKIREERDKAWREISTVIVPQFEDFTKEEKREIDKKIHQRWRTARDMYKKDLLAEKTKKGIQRKKRSKYVYFDMMKFLDSVITKDEPVAELPTKTAVLPPTVPVLPPQKNPEKLVDFDEPCKCFKSRLELEREDLAFFQSLQPTLKKFTNYQKIMFRSKVLQIIMEMQNPAAKMNYFPSQPTEQGSSNATESDPLSPYIERAVPYEEPMVYDTDSIKSESVD